jgi:hypothetical protein
MSFGQEDHPEHIPNPGRTPLIMDTLIGGCRLSRVLMDGGSVTNIVYANTLFKTGIPQIALRPSQTEFHGVIPGRKAEPLG